MAEQLVSEDDEKRVYEDSGENWTSTRVEWKSGTAQSARETALARLRELYAKGWANLTTSEKSEVPQLVVESFGPS